MSVGEQQSVTPPARPARTPLKQLGAGNVLQRPSHQCMLQSSHLPAHMLLITMHAV